MTTAPPSASCWSARASPFHGALGTFDLDLQPGKGQGFYVLPIIAASYQGLGCQGPTVDPSSEHRVSVSPGVGDRKSSVGSHQKPKTKKPLILKLVCFG